MDDCLGIEPRCIKIKDLYFMKNVSRVSKHSCPPDTAQVHLKPEVFWYNISAQGPDILPDCWFNNMRFFFLAYSTELKSNSCSDSDHGSLKASCQHCMFPMKFPGWSLFLLKWSFMWAKQESVPELLTQTLSSRKSYFGDTDIMKMSLKMYVHLGFPKESNM